MWKLVPAEEVAFGLGENTGLDRSLRESCALPGQAWFPDVSLAGESGPMGGHGATARGRHE